MTNFNNTISKFSSKKILVIGDIILDRHIQGSVSRISPEAPVPVVLEEKSFYTPGGAANVSHNLSCLGAKVFQVGIIGDDLEGAILTKDLKKKGIDTQGIIVDKKVPTVTKTRIIAQHQQVVRIDKEKIRKAANKAVDEKVRKFIDKKIASVDAVIISDYGKGMITKDLVNYICALAVDKKKIITVDPKVEHFCYYRKVSAITPNKKEAENAIRNIKLREDGGRLRINHDRLDTIKLIDQAGTQLMKYLELDSLLITLGEAGMRLFDKKKKPITIKTKAKEVFDVTGAGDAVISVYTLALTTGASKREAAELSNIAAGVVVGKLGAVAVTKDDLKKAVSSS